MAKNVDQKTFFPSLSLGTSVAKKIKEIMSMLKNNRKNWANVLYLYSLSLKKKFSPKPYCM
jgi:hypothetical protein